jgi:3-methyladenine DNA glycosylase AlkC
MHTPTPAVTPPPLSVQAPGWEEVTVHTLCLEVEQSYPEIEGKEPEPIAETAQRILARIGVQVVAEGASCDATLTVTLSGRALGANYLGAGYCYSGAEVEGRMDLIVPGREPFTQPISADYAPQYSISDCPRAAGAPFLRVWPEALVDGLGHLWGPHSLIQALEDEELEVRRSAALALGEMGPAAVDAVPALIRALEDENVFVRRDAADALGDIGPGAVEAVPALIQALGDENDYVRMAARYALRNIGPEAVPVLIEALGDENSKVRLCAADALGAIGPEAKEAVPALIQALGDEEVYVRGAAAVALGVIGPEAKEAVPALIRALEDENVFVRRDAAGALTNITGQDFGQDAAAWQEWWEEQQ